MRERGVSVKQAALDLNVHENVLRKWVKDFSADPQHAFPGQGQVKPEQLEIERLRREVQKLKAERDILKKPPLLREGMDMKFGFVALAGGLLVEGGATRRSAISARWSSKCRQLARMVSTTPGAGHSPVTNCGPSCPLSCGGEED